MVYSPSTGQLEKAGELSLSAGEREFFAKIGSLPLESGDLAGLSFQMA